MAEYRNRNRILYPLGVTQEENGVHILVQGRAGEVRLLLYRPGAVSYTHLTLPTNSLV